jgi:hypothetical protein
MGKKIASRTTRGFENKIPHIARCSLPANHCSLLRLNIKTKIHLNNCSYLIAGNLRASSPRPRRRLTNLPPPLSTASVWAGILFTKGEGNEKICV